MRAGRLTLNALQPKRAVDISFVVPDAESLRERGVDRIPAQHRAERVGAHADVVLPHRTPLVHRVKSRDRGDLGSGETQHVGDDPHRLRGDLILNTLGKVQHRHHRGAGLGIPGHDVAHLVAHVLVEGHQRSTPPMTGSMLATAAMTSEIIDPSHMAAVACRLLKEGSR